MHDSLCMRSAKTVEKLQRDRFPLLQWQGSPFQALGQSFALKELHAQVGKAGVLSQIVDAADIAMAYPPRDLHFPMKTFQQAGIGAKLGSDDLDRDSLVQFPVQSLIDLAHTAPADASNDLEAICDDVSRLNCADGKHPWKWPEKRCVRLGMLNQTPQFLADSGVLDAGFNVL